MKLISYGVRQIEQDFFHKLNKYGYELVLVSELLNDDNVTLAQGSDVVMLRANCKSDKANLKKFKDYGVKYILTRTVGFDHIDLDAVKELGFELCARVPSYSPTSVSELAVSLALGLSRKTIAMTANSQSKNFIAYDNYFAKEVRHSTVGIIGTGKIGICVAKAFLGLGATVLGHDPYPSEEAKSTLELVDLDILLKNSDIVLLHCPYIKGVNYHFVNKEFISKMKNSSILINAARGELIDLEALLEAIETNKLMGVAMDAVENEKEFFFKDLKGKSLPNPIVEKLLSYYPRVLFTPHLGSFTDEALSNMISISYDNLNEFLNTGKCENTLI